MITNLHNIYRKDRNRHGGGVIIGVKKGLKTIPLDITTHNIETISVKLYNGNQKYIISSVYVTPNITTEQMIELKLFIKNLTQNYPDYRLIICGDFNLNFLDKRKPIIQEFKKFLNAHGLLQKVKSYTYPSFISESTQKSLLDLIIVNNEENVSVVNTNQSISKTCDHLLIDFRIDFITETESNLNIFFTDYSNEVNLSEFRLRLKNFNWDQIFDQNLDINEIYDKMIDVLVDIKNECFIPKKVKKKPIFDKNIKRLIKLKRKSFKTF